MSSAKGLLLLLYFHGPMKLNDMLLNRWDYDCTVDRVKTGTLQWCKQVPTLKFYKKGQTITFSGGM